ncbi:alpha/beta hydrolase [Glaciihabitans sp. dw_435]|uniref:alpha/beta hydrolase n=1 Tax=Glaciihabitans sp. dw_435 TaxID=2720081 RepID=UPI0027DE8658|nr:alpha/beta hydrolase [Glaciihabitans sp. dw_435]
MPRFTAIRDDQSFVDAHGVTIRYYVWRASKPKGVVQLAHGLGDHAARYEDLAQDLVNAGYSVFADDHRGHGQTGLGHHGGDRTKLGRLGPGGMRATVAAVRQLTGIIRAEHPDLPIVLFGHSWGSIIAQKIINVASVDYDGVVLSGTAYRTFRHMNGGDLNARHAHLGTTGYEWLSRDDAVAIAFRDDDLTFPANALKLFGVRESLGLLGKPARKLQKDLPVLIQVGSDDPFGGATSAELLAEAYINRSELSQVSLHVYPGARHEIYNETNRAEVTDDLIEWLNERFEPAL